MENKSFIGIALCILFYLGYTQYLQKKYPTENEETPAPVAPESNPPPANQVPPETARAPRLSQSEITPEASQKPLVMETLTSEELTFENKVVKIAFNQEISALNSIRLKKYKGDVKSSAPVELLDSPLIMQGRVGSKASTYERGFSAQRKGDTLTLTRTAFPWAITEEFQFEKGESYGGRLKVTFKNISESPQDLNASLYIGENLAQPKESSMFVPNMENRYNAVIIGTDGSREEELIHDHCEETDAKAVTEGKDENIDFIGFDKHYFLKMAQPIGKKFSYRVEKLVTRDAGTCPIMIELSQPQGQIAAGESSALEFRTYFGPKEMQTLAQVSDDFTPTLNLGWFSIIAQPLLRVVKGFYKFTHNYGIAIIVLTILLKLLFYPLTKAAAVSMKNMQKYQPELNRIRDKYKDDKATQQKEIMAFMSKHKINPAKGCLPILPQIPVFIAFYNVLSQSVELRHAPFFGWIKDLSAADPYYISPLLLGVGMFVQQKLTPTPSIDKTQQRIMLLMPVMFTAMMLTLPAGLVLYMIANTIVSIAQQQWLNKKLGLHVAKEN